MERPNVSTVTCSKFFEVYFTAVVLVIVLSYKIWFIKL